MSFLQGPFYEINILFYRVLFTGSILKIWKDIKYQKKKDVYRGITIHGGYHEKDGCISYYIDIIWCVLFNSNKKTLDLPDTSKVEFGHVHGGAMTTVYELNQNALFKKIVALGYLIQQKSHNDTRNRLP